MGQPMPATGKAQGYGKNGYKRTPGNCPRRQPGIFGSKVVSAAVFWFKSGSRRRFLVQKWFAPGNFGEKWFFLVRKIASRKIGNSADPFEFCPRFGQEVKTCSHDSDNHSRRVGERG